MPAVTELIEIRKLYHGRKRAKQVIIGLERLAWGIDALVYVIASPVPPNRGGAIDRDALIVIQVKCAPEHEDFVKGLMVMGEPEQGNYNSVELDPAECLEFYQGTGVTRFRGV